jgi:hypothetical protein
MSTLRKHPLLPALIVALCVGAASAQTRITAPTPNKYSPADDVKVGREAAAEVRKQLPLLNDDRVDSWAADIGRNLVNAIPAELRHSEFRYTFEVVNQKDINAFALPGGPMFLNRGMIESARNEAQVAGVMAHEISHVALRHGTAQATKGEKFQIGAIAGQVLGAIVGGAAGTVISQGSQFGLGAYFMKYSREYERQADLLGAQIMARAGYDPREMANMFKIIESQGSGGGPEWLSDHPNPGNRYDAIQKEASMLRVQGNANTGDFSSIQARLKSMAPAYTAEQIARGQARSGRTTGTSGRRTVNVDLPSTQYRTYRPSNFLRVSVPENWDQIDTGTAVTYAPDGGFFDDSGQTTFTHGVEIGVTQGGTGNLQRDTQELLKSFARSNPDLRTAGSAKRETVGGRQGLTQPLQNVSAVTGDQEYVALTTTQLRDGSLLYMIGVAPRQESGAYENAFRRVRQSMQIAD